MRKPRRSKPGDFDFETAETIRQRIRNIAQRERISQMDLSARTGYSGPYVSRLLSGRRRLSSDHLEKLSLALETPVSFLKEPRRLKRSDESFYDERLTSIENSKMAGILHEIKECLVNYFLKKRRQKRKVEKADPF